jgi:thiol-disulfide isomerase/thioredoxin
MQRLLVLSRLFLAVVIAGCQSQPLPQPAQDGGAEKPTDAALETAKSAPPGQSEPDVIAVIPIDDQGLQSAVEKHAGKVVLVDCWATWCVPCVRSFPHTVELSRKYANEGLVVMSLSFDDPADEETLIKVQDFLRQHDATFENYISKLDLAADGATAFGIEDGAIPHYKLYDRSGKLFRALSAADPDRPLTEDVLDAAVVEALK